MPGRKVFVVMVVRVGPFGFGASVCSLKTPVSVPKTNYERGRDSLLDISQRIYCHWVYTNLISASWHHASLGDQD